MPHHNRLTIARKHATRGREIIARQRELIRAIRANRRDSAAAEDLLIQFERSLTIFEADLAEFEA